MQRELPTRLRSYPEWELTQRIVSAFYETYNTLGFGFLESVYRDALLYELRRREIAAEAEVPLRVRYKGNDVGFFRLDILVGGRVAIELKASTVLGPADKRQLLNYLRVSNLDVGLLLHFGPEPKVHRLVSPRVVLDSRDDPTGSSR